MSSSYVPESLDFGNAYVCMFVCVCVCALGLNPVRTYSTHALKYNLSRRIFMTETNVLPNHKKYILSASVE